MNKLLYKETRDKRSIRDRRHSLAGQLLKCSNKTIRKISFKSGYFGFSRYVNNDSW